ncbi:unnamed protein product [Allacma fusca]|uniref:Uncharacterized protein n=1 Tax=Allacma fusca TaxID=39272 RepID=A0A8J2JEU2_9HEXA|nr:unnamed protein product [Allacma fusca]
MLILLALAHAYPSYNNNNFIGADAFLDPKILLQDLTQVPENSTTNSPSVSSPLLNLFLWTIQQLKSHHIQQQENSKEHLDYHPVDVSVSNDTAILHATWIVIIQRTLKLPTSANTVHYSVLTYRNIVVKDQTKEAGI